MDLSTQTAVIGTNAWGSKLYSKLVRGSYVEDDVIKAAMKKASENDLLIYDSARDYGLGKEEKMLGEFGTDGIILSAKYTPFTHYKAGCVRKSFEKDLKDFKRGYIDIYWLHLPTDMEEHLNEIIEIYKEGKIGYVGISNFNIEECQRAKKILEESGVPLYGVQNHYSILCRDWEENGLLDWCKANAISFWAWAILEEGILVDTRKSKKRSPFRKLYKKKEKNLSPLYEVLFDIADRRQISVPQLSMAFCHSKGIMPICGCRKPYQVEELAIGSKITLSDEEIRRIESAADSCNVKVMGKDIFRMFVLKEKKKK